MDLLKLMNKMDKFKYYTPDREELHYGFEYEFRPRIPEGMMSHVEQKFTYVDWWKKQTIGEEGKTLIEKLENHQYPYHLSDVLQYLRDGAVRVKHLDKEDIESLGWKQMGVRHYENSNKNSLIIHPDGKIIILVSSHGTCLFDGKIRNKSELKKIMQQIDIK